MTFIANLVRYAETLRHLRTVQFTNRLTRRLRRPRAYVGPEPKLRTVTGRWVLPIAKKPSLVGPREFRFLNEEGSLDEIGWAAIGKSDLWRYNLHYFDDWSASGFENRKDCHRSLEADWLSQNPPCAPVSWDAYPTSLRLINLAKVILSGGRIHPTMFASMASQALWLERQLEYHLLGNHLYANAKALMFTGAVLDGALGNRLWSSGVALTCSQTKEQMLADGGHFELSPMYHSIILEDMLDILNLIEARQDPNPRVAELRSLLVSAVGKAKDWLEAMSHPDGEISFFNDAAFGVAPSPTELARYAERLELNLPAMRPGSQRLVESGYARLEVGKGIVIADVGEVGASYQPGHGHADTLSFEWSWDGRRIIVNGGTSEYGISPERNRQRGTAAHSTVELDGQNSSDTWAGFRVGRRARAKVGSFECQPERVALEAGHDGYRFLPGKPQHERRWELTPNSLQVKDRWHPADECASIIRFHLHPSVVTRWSNDGWELRHIDIPDQSIRVTSDLPMGVEESTWHPIFGASETSQCLVIRAPARSHGTSLVEFTW